MLKVALFYAVFTPASTWLEHFLAGQQGWNEYLVTGINMVLNFVLEFLYDRFFVFRGSWLYMLISLLGIGVCRIDIFTKNYLNE